MMKLLVHDAAGRILRTIGGPTLEAGHALLDVSDDARDLAALTGEHLMVVDGEIVARPELAGFDRLEIRADGEDAATLTGLPDGAVIYVEGGAYAAPDGTFGLAVVIPGLYRVTVEAWPYRRYDATITATEAV